MKVYNVEETQIGNYFRINYELARQLMMIHDSYKQRILDASVKDIDNTILERTFHFENKVSYGYSEMPKGWKYYLGQPDRHDNYKDFINWFLRYKQQPSDYLINGVMKDRNEKRQPINKAHDNTITSSEYGGIPVDIDNGDGYKPSGFTRF